MFRVGENGCLDGGEVMILFFGRPPCNNAGVMNEEAIIYDVGDSQFFGKEFGPETFTCPAFSNQRIDYAPLESLLNIVKKFRDILAGEIEPALLDIYRFSLFLIHFR